MLTDLGNDLNLRSFAMIGLCFSGLIVSLISNRQMASWKEILILYFHVDSILPVFITAFIAFYSLMKFFTFTRWQTKVFLAVYPVWTIYLIGNLRIMLLYAKWNRWKVVLYKLVIVASGLMGFMIGYKYMLGKYKIFNSYYLYLEIE